MRFFKHFGRTILIPLRSINIFLSLSYFIIVFANSSREIIKQSWDVYFIISKYIVKLSIHKTFFITYLFYELHAILTKRSSSSINLREHSDQYFVENYLRAFSRPSWSSRPIPFVHYGSIVPMTKRRWGPNPSYKWPSLLNRWEIRNITRSRNCALRAQKIYSLFSIVYSI